MRVWLKRGGLSQVVSLRIINKGGGLFLDQFFRLIFTEEGSRDRVSLQLPQQMNRRCFSGFARLSRKGESISAVQGLRISPNHQDNLIKMGNTGVSNETCYRSLVRVCSTEKRLTNGWRFSPHRCFCAAFMTIFKKIINREIPADIVYEDDDCIAFRDVHPQAPVHVLLIPKKPIASLNELEEDDVALCGHLMSMIPKIASGLGLTGGYRTVVNTGPHGGQTVYHLHIHILGGRDLAWPPG